jgi:hypothetical protein
MSIKIIKYKLDEYKFSPIVGTVSLVDYYGYDTTFGASAAPTIQEKKCLTIFFYKDLTTGKIGLVGIVDAHDDGNSGNLHLKIYGLPSTSKLVVSDDGGEATFKNGVLEGKFVWADCCTDGFAVDEINDFSTLKLSILSATNIDKIKLVNSDGSVYYKSFNNTINIDCKKEIFEISDYILLNPGEGSYSQDKLNIEINYSDEVKSVNYGFDKNPTIAKYIAYDNLNPPNPFIATVQDGKGNVLFDGGFPKFYNRYWNDDWKVFSDMAPSFKYLANVMDFIANPEKVEKGNKKILILGDAIGADSYCIIDNGSSDFKKSLEGVANIQKYELTFKVRNNYKSGKIDCSYDELKQYCGVILFSTKYTNNPLITDNAVKNLLLFRESGNGIFIITDHGINISSLDQAKQFPYSSNCFFTTANKLVVKFGAWFSGNYNRHDVQVGYLRKNYGDSPLYKNLTDDDYIHAGGSESRIFLQESKLLDKTQLQNVEISGQGYHKLNFLLYLNDGSIVTRTYTYGLKIGKPLIVKDKNNNEIGGFFELKTNMFEFKLTSEIDDNFEGYIKINDKVAANFNRQNGSFNIKYYDGYNNPLKVKNGDVVLFLITSPFDYSKSITIKILFEFDFHKEGLKMSNFFKKIEKNFGKKIVNYPKYFAQFKGLKIPLKLKKISKNEFDVTKALNLF